MVPNVPWHRASAVTAPRATKKNNYLCYMANQGVLLITTSIASQSAVTQTSYLIKGFISVQPFNLN